MLYATTWAIAHAPVLTVVLSQKGLTYRVTRLAAFAIRSIVGC
ncbi:MAG: hypothetical protein ACYSVY_22270 [Planctomycetota bacterium]|jgi:hypothetical protein